MVALRPDGQRILLACEQADLFPDVPRNSVQLAEYTFLTGQLRLLSTNGSGKPIDGALLPDAAYASDAESIFFGFGPADGAEIGVHERPGMFLTGPEPATQSRFPHLTPVIQQTSTTGRQPSTSFEASTSDDGRFVLFVSFAGDLGQPAGADRYQNLYLRNLVVWDTATTNVILSRPLGSATVRSLHFSADGKSIAFSTTTSLNVADRNVHSDVYVLRLTNSTPILISTTPSGLAGNGLSDQPALSPDGSQVAFRSRATDLTKDAVSGIGDVFLREPSINRTRRVLDSMPLPPRAGPALYPRFATDGTEILLTSSNEVAPGDRNDTHDLYLVSATAASVPVPPQLKISSTISGGWSLRWVGQSGIRYQAETTDLLGQDWSTLGIPLAGTGANLLVDDPRPGGLARFYRVKVIP